jgi:hypothetical protein
VLVALALAARPGPAAAQPAAWHEQATEHFIIVYPPASEPQVAVVAGRAEEVYAALSALLGTGLEPPVTVRLFPTLDAFLRANPLATVTNGLFTRPHRSRREIGLLVPDGPDGPDAAAYELDDALRYELGHLLLAQLSDERLPVAFRDGLARYLEQPGERFAPGVAQLRAAWSRDGVYGWSELTGPGADYLDPPVTQPQGLSMAHFLVDRFGLAATLDFVRASAAAPDWREAMALAFGRPAEQLEAEWQSWLPGYLDGGWRAHALRSADLRPAEALLARGDYAGAAAQLHGTIALLGADEPAVVARARELLVRAQLGQAAERRLDGALAALAAGDYGRARGEADEARAVLGQLGNTAAEGMAAEAARRAELGLVATHALERSARLPPWRAVQARVQAERAALGFAQLGNDAAALQAQAAAAGIDRRLAPAGWALLLLGLSLLAWNARRRWRDRAAGSPVA